ncbi:lysophospholipase a [Seiridium cupressi]
MFLNIDSFIGSYLPDQFAFNASKLLNDKIVQNFTGTAEGGPNWVEYLTGCAVENGQYVPANCPVQLWDFAFAGASVSQQFLPLHHNYTVPLVNQTQQYLTYADSILTRAPIRLNKRKSLVAIWIGINDVNDSLASKPNGTSYEDFWDAELSAVFTQSVTPLLNVGFKNFLFVNLPPLDRTPSNQKTTTPYPSKSQVDTWGSSLAEKAAAFQQENAGVTALLYDANTFLNGVMDNPDDYGVTNTTSYCPGYNQADVLTNPGNYGCAPLDEYFWYNTGHM